MGEPWPETYIGGVRTTAELEVVSRTALLLVAVVSGASAVTIVAGFVGGLIRGNPIIVLSSIAIWVLSTLAAVLWYRSARIIERSLAPRVSERESLSALETESLMLMRVLEVFGDSERAVQWMRESNPALNNEPPIRIIQTEKGRREVLNILGRIQHGVIS